MEPFARALRQGFSLTADNVARMGLLPDAGRRPCEFRAQDLSCFDFGVRAPSLRKR
jgi:hypothetical protein